MLNPLQGAISVIPCADLLARLILPTAIPTLAKADPCGFLDRLAVMDAPSQVSRSHKEDQQAAQPDIGADL